MTFPFAKEREQFPILNEKTQLSSCSQSAMSNYVKAAMNEYTESWSRDGMDWMGWMERVERAKASFASLINASPDEIAVLSSVSECASSIASALTFSKGRNKIFTTEIDFPCIGHVWLAQQERGGEVHFIPSENNKVPLEYYEKYVDEQTVVTSIPHVSYYNGFKQDIKKLLQLFTKKDLIVLLMPISLQEM
jgi:selenocysteine lyase/cysteine desulfurase